MISGVPARADEPELLDLGAGTPADARANLNEMWRLNALLGGVRAVMAHLAPLLRGAAGAGTVTVLDIGTGAAHFPIYLSRWARRNGIGLRAFGVDLAVRNLMTARANVQTLPRSSTLISLAAADALALPFQTGGVDVAVSTLFLHHLSPAQVVAALREASRLARRGVVMSDLIRGYLPLAGFRLIGPLLARHPLTRHDGLLSIRRAYTPAELTALAREAGLTTARVYRHLPAHMTLVAGEADV